MKAVVIHDYSGDKQSSIRVEDVPTPEPGPGQVLVKMAASPINPSDLMFVRGRYGITRPLPMIPGFEGAGEVVDAGRGVLSQMRKGKRVIALATDGLDGAWAEYMVTDVRRIWPVPDALTYEQAATAVVNPLTAIALLEMARERRAEAVVSTAAASALGRMMLRLANERGLPVIHIVRREDQVSLLREMGGEYVLNSNEDDFDARLNDLTRELNATVLFDAVGGELTGQVLKAMPRGSSGVVYGALSNTAAAVPASQLIFRGQTLTGFWLAKPLRSLSALGFVRVLVAARDILNGSELVQTEIRARHSLDEVHTALDRYAANMTDGKVLFLPNG